MQLESTEVVRRAQHDPQLIVRVRMLRPLQAPGEVTLSTQGQMLHSGPAPADTWTIDVPLVPNANIKVVVSEGDTERTTEFAFSTPDDRWVLHFIPGFHYDPVWWNTQAHYTETGYRMGDTVGPGLTLVREYLRKCFEDPDYTVALHQLPYLKTFLEAHPEDSAALRKHIHSGRCSIVGGTYNELSTTLISAEATARNAIYGTLFQTHLLNGDGHVWWQCDVFGHDPSFPSLMADTGHTAGAFARGPFHQWGAPRDQVNFPSEFYWMGPDGKQVLTHYMTGHYGYAYGKLATGSNWASKNSARRTAIIVEMFEDLKRPALTEHVLLPMHMDFIRPLENLGDVVRKWNEQVISPRAEMSTPQRYFDDLRSAIRDRNIRPPVITRDMNPVYTGCAVSFADLKTANRDAEVMLREAEIFATLACLHGASYPWRSIDRAWRQLLFNAHHDAVTGSMSDQVYVDVMYIYRDALEIATQVRDKALAYMNAHVVGLGGDGVVWNPGATPRRYGSGSSAVTVPACGFSHIRDGDQSDPLALQDGMIVLENDVVRAVIDPSRGGTITSLTDVRSRRELMRGPGNDLVVHDEYETLPGHGEGPWHLAPTGRRTSGATVAAQITTSNSTSVEMTARYAAFTRRMRYELQADGRLDMTTTIEDWAGSNKLLRVEFPIDLPGARPVYQTAAAVIGRPFARDIDTATDSWTLDQTCWQWVALGSTVVLEVVDDGDIVHRRALGVAEIVIGDDADNNIVDRAGQLAEALVKAGVTSTITRSSARRYGDLEYDSNLPDFRIAMGRTALTPNAGTTAQLRWTEQRDVPLLSVPHGHIGAVMASINGQQKIRVSLANASIEQRHIVADYSVALFNRGSVSAHISDDGTMGLNLMRSCTSWPAGVWIDKPARRLPDGASLETMHGSHTFRYALLPHRGDFREAALNRRGQDFNHPMVLTPPEIMTTRYGKTANSFVKIDPPGVLLTAMKPAGYPEAMWESPTKHGPRMVTAFRLWNGTGRPVDAKLEVRHLAAQKATRANLLEEPTGEELEVHERIITVPMQPNEMTTVLCLLQRARNDSGSLEVVDTAPAPSAYWLENLGEGVTGNGVLAVAPAGREVTLVDDHATMAIRVLNNDRRREAKVALSFTGPSDLQIELNPSTLTIPASGVGEATLHVTGTTASNASDGLIQISTSGSVTWPVTAAIWVRSSDDATTPAVTITNDAAIVEPNGILSAQIQNRTAGPITGEAAWLAPQILWPTMDQWRQRVTIPAGGTITVQAQLSSALDSYALLRFAYGGRLAYGPTIGVTSNPQKPFMAFDVQRLRLHRDRSATLRVTARSIAGLTGASQLTLETPEGWQVRQTSKIFRQHSGDAELTVAYEVTPTQQPDEAQIMAAGPHGARAVLQANVVPIQNARSTASLVIVDGRLDEWADAEFTEAQDDLGRVRAAARYDSGGLVLAFDVEDEVFNQTHAGAGIWQGDSVQFGLSTTPSSQLGYQESDFEYGAAQSPDGPIVWCWIAGTGGRTGQIEGAEVAVEVDGSRTRYEMRLPRSSLPPLRLKPGHALGFTYIANDNDGDGFRGATQWTRGISGGKDPSLFGDLILLP
jgi:hypothetical protein